MEFHLVVKSKTVVSRVGGRGECIELEDIMLGEMSHT